MSRLDEPGTSSRWTARSVRARCDCGSSTPVATPSHGFQLAFTTVVQLTPTRPAQLVSRTSGWHVVAPPDGTRLEPGATWELELTCGHRPGHANDGPTGAYVILADGATVPVRTTPTVRVVAGSARALRLATADSGVAAAWATTAERELRLHPGSSPVLSTTDGDDVDAVIDAALGAEEFTITVDGPRCGVTAGSPETLQVAFAALARERRVGEIRPARHTPAYGWRGLHVDLARQFFPADDVDWLIDVAAWRGFNRLHLHLTDDEAWRLPVDGYPALTEVGAWRGHGMPIPPLLGSGPAPYGGSYTPAQIAGWVARAAAGGVVIVPEVDLPGHCFAALAAVPALRDPDDRSGAVSVQSFVDNVLNPGVAATRPFLEAVAGALADLFPSPWLHVGGDEVADGAWSCSPAAQAYAAARGIEGSSAVGAAFMAEIIELVSATTGRRVGVWQEAAESGALRPGEGYVVGWKSGADCRQAGRRRTHGGGRAGRGLLPRHGRRRRLGVARRELGRSLVGRRHRGLRPGRRLVARRAGAPGRHPGLPLDRARPRPPDPRTPALPPPRRHRRHGLADPVLNRSQGHEWPRNPRRTVRRCGLRCAAMSACL